MNAPKPARLVDDVRARLQVQVVGVGQDRLRAELCHALRQHGLDRRLGADGDERRRLDIAVRGSDDASTPEPPGQFRIDTERRHVLYSINLRKRTVIGTRVVDFAG